MDILNRHILVVEDSEDTATLYALVFTRAGYKVTVAHSGEEALHLAELSRFDLILSDIGMPRMNGYELAERLRVMPAYAHVPLISVTGFDIFGDRERSRRAGFNKHFIKPVNPQTLLDAVSLLVNEDG